MVILGSSFEQTMMGWRFRCYIPNFVEIGPLVLEKKIFEGFLPYMGLAAILGHVNNISFPLPMEAPHKIWLSSAKQFQRRRSLKLWKMTDGRIPEHGYTISSPCEPSAQVS